MDSPVLTLVIALFFAFTVESHRIPQPRSPPAPLSPPPRSSTPPPPPSLASRRRSSAPPPPPPPRKPPAPAVQNGGNHKLNTNLSPPPKKEKTNMGKKIGLMFVGIASVLQVCIVAFLLISRRQLMKTHNGYQRN